MLNVIIFEEISTFMVIIIKIVAQSFEKCVHDLYWQQKLMTFLNNMNTKIT